MRCLLVMIAHRFIAATGGNIVITAALVLPALFAAAALVVDEAALYHQKRQLQAAVDLAAIQAASDPGRALDHAYRTLVDNGIFDGTEDLALLAAPIAGRLEVIPGGYSADPGLAPASRFVAAQHPPNAVQVALSAPGQLYFARSFLFDEPQMRVQAVASATPQAAFSIGSRLARLDGGVANALLGALLGTQLSLSLVDYDRIASLNITMLDFLDRLAGEIGIAAGGYDRVLDARVRLADIATALALASGGADPGAAHLLFDLAGRIDDGLTIEMARLIAADGLAGIAIGTPQAGLSATIDALEMLSVAAVLADGERQAALSLGAGLPGIAGLSVRLVVGEPPQGAWYRLGGPDSFVRTAQIRLRLDVSLIGHGGLGVGVLNVVLPVYVELAFAEARLASLTCPPGRPGLAQASLGVRPGIVRLAVGQMSQQAFLDTRQPLSVARTPIVNVAGIAQVTARGLVESAAMAPQYVQFSAQDAANGVVRSVSTHTPLASLTRSLTDDLDLRIELLGANLLGPLLNGVTGTVGTMLAPVASGLDDVLVTLMSVLGLAVGQADVRVHGFDCRAATLVQ